MNFISYDFEIKRELRDVDAEFDKIKKDVEYYLKHKNKTAIRLKNYDNMMKMKEKVEACISDINTNYNGSVLMINRITED